MYIALLTVIIYYTLLDNFVIINSTHVDTCHAMNIVIIDQEMMNYIAIFYRIISSVSIDARVVEKKALEWLQHNIKM